MRMPASLRIAAAAPMMLLVTPALAHACAVCGGGTDRMRIAFLISTAFLSLLPLALIFSGVWWLRRQVGAAMSDEFLDRDELADARSRIEITPGALETAGEPARS